MLLLLLLPFLQPVANRDVSKDTRYVIKHINSCPDVGYFFQRERTLNSLDPGVCQLCFCHEDMTAICWERENRRCDLASYQNLDEKRRDARVKRSPLGLGDIFFRDAARDVFNKNTEPACKPFETSFGEGCPPADWCTGCTVCDCDANGRWNCHVLSFCPDKEDKNVVRAQKKAVQKSSRPTVQYKPTMTTTRTPKVMTTPKKRLIKKRKTWQQKTPKPAKRNNNLDKKNSASRKPLLIKKAVATKKPVFFGSNVKVKMNSTMKEAFTQEVVKRVVAVMQKAYNKTLSAQNNQPCPKIVKKRSMDKKAMNARKLKNIKRFNIQQENKKKQYKKNVVNNKTRLGNKIKGKPVKVDFKSNDRKAKSNQKFKSRQKREAITFAVEDVTNSIADVLTKTEAKYSSENEIFNNATTTNNYYLYKLFESKDSFTNIPQIILTTNLGDGNNRILGAGSMNKTIDPQMKTKSNDTGNASNQILNTNVLNSSIDTNINVLSKNNLYNISKSYYNKKEDKNNNNKNLTENTTERPYFRKIKNNNPDIIRLLTKYNGSNKAYPIKYNSRSIVNHNRTGDSLNMRIFRKIDDIQNVLKRLLFEFRKNNTKLIKTRTKKRKFNLIKYLKKFFIKFFRKRNGKAAVNSEKLHGKRFNNYIIETICEIYENCNRNFATNKILLSKTKQLNTESNEIMKSIKIIKGLLKLVDLKDISNTNSNTSKFKNDIHKLNFILRDKYSKRNITQDKITQFNYIKDNTKVFIKSVGRFINTFNEIVKMLTNKSESKETQADSTEPAIDNIEHSVTQDFDKLKLLLIKYNLIQNRFMRKIYQTLNKFESNSNSSKVSYKNDKINNMTVDIENYSRNIIENLRKLKNLAGTRNSNARVKRAVMGEDDSIEYLLTLMEYLIKQNYPLEVAPVNDGIDVLIEAIKNGPDVKPMPQVLQYVPSNVRVSRTTETPPLKISEEDSASNIEKDSSNNSSTSYQSESGTDTEEISNLERDVDKIFTGKDNNENTESILVPEDTSTTQSFITVIETNTFEPIKKRNENENQQQEIIEKFLTNDDKNKKIEVFSVDNDDYDGNVYIASITTTTESDIETDEELSVTTIAPVETTEFKMVELKQYTLNGVSSYSSAKEKRITLEWLDDSSEEVDKSSNETVTKNSKGINGALSTKRPAGLQKHVEGISSLSKETEEDNKKVLHKLNAEDVLNKKQTDFLNSLDYGVEKSDTEDEKEETFPSYYN